MKIETLLEMPKLLKVKLESGSLDEWVTLIRQSEMKYPLLLDAGLDVEHVVSGEIDKIKIARLQQALLMRIGLEYVKRAPFVDYRELDDMIEISKEFGFETVELKLGEGDYQSPKRETKTINIERKADDFLASLFDKGHIYKQLKHMDDNANVKAAYLMCTKSWDDLKSMLEPTPKRPKPIPRTVLIGYVGRLIEMGYPPVFIPDKRDFMDVVDWLFTRFYERPEEIKVVNKAIEVKSNKIIIFPGIGDKIGEDLIKHFGNIKNVVNATEERLKEVKGIGKKLAKEIFEMVNGGD